MNMFYESVFVVDEDYKLSDKYDTNPSGARLAKTLQRRAQDKVLKANKAYHDNPTAENEAKWSKASERLRKAGSKVDSYYGDREHANEGTKKYRKGAYYKQKVRDLIDRD